MGLVSPPRISTTNTSFRTPWQDCSVSYHALPIVTYKISHALPTSSFYTPFYWAGSLHLPKGQDQ